MIRIRTSALALALLTTTAPSALADDAHHPGGAAPAAPPAAATPQAGAPASGTMGGGMMGADHMSQMMGMMQMMHGMSGMGASSMAMPGMDMTDRIEGRIAFLRTELKIADAQAKVWDDFAEALRHSAHVLQSSRAKAAAATAPSPVLRLEQQEQWYAARLDGIRALKAPLAQLYAALSDEQKKTADQLLPPHLGMMPMTMMAMGAMPMRTPDAAGGKH
jgi:hypothetical protein